MTDKRITLFRNESKSQGKVLFVPDSLDQLLKKAGQKFKCEVTGLYTSEGEEFVPPGTPKQDVEEKQKKRSDWITLNVGGKLFTTSKSTLTKKEPMSMLARMFAEDQGDYLFTPSNIDVNGMDS
ncbi:KHA, dimerization domain of potassium ion channel [Popillia japonica]|uniref:KHA, dimerization domain of potassium ion channel n=1 Tax=Popillia japonica TaxID=7064 RepID=A0AAW1ML19_POPJA